MFTPELRRRLSEIARGKSLSSGPPPEPEPPAPSNYTLEFAFSGNESRNDLGSFLVCEYRASEMLTDINNVAAKFLSACSSIGIAPQKILFLDLETCGLANVPLFLIGTMTFSEDDLKVRQLFARDYSEEKPILAVISQMIAESDAVVSFNGKSFDLPYLKDRMTLHRLEFIPPGVHHDLVISARRKWRRSLPDCRLQTLEALICGRHRCGDIPGSEIPRLYHDYVKSGELDPLLPVFKHNILDLVTMAELLPELADQLHRPEAKSSNMRKRNDT